MGFDEGSIVLDSPNGAYYPGQTLFGRLEFGQNSVKTFRGIYVKIKGYCKIHWTTDHIRRENDRSISYTVTHESYEEYIDIKIFLAGGKDGEHQLQAGRHEFPFQCHIPQNCPSSFEGKYGHVRYQVKVVVDRAFKFDQEKLATFRIVAPLDLNTLPYCKEPVQMELINTFCGCCVSTGSAQTLVKLPVGGYCPGQVLPIEVNCNNTGSSVAIEKIQFVTTKIIVYHAATEPDTRRENHTLAEMKKGPVPANTSRLWGVDMEVPAMDVLNMTGCRYIDVEYFLEVTVVADGCHEDTEESHPIMIGSIPLVGFQDDVQNPMQDQMPQSREISNNFQGVMGYPPAITSQPLPGASPYPTPSPYPSNNYPGNNSPYPGRNSPYPGANSPYPGTNPPYPGQNPAVPYPVPRPQYPGVSPPYPVTPPVNPGSSPYPSNTPYPGGSPAAPYPATASSYPGVHKASNSPNTGSRVLKTGTFGFTMQGSDTGNEVSIPLLPPGATVPVNSSANNPYVSASAPEPSTPDSENKKPMCTPSTDVTPSNPPYNPDFH